MEYQFYVRANGKSLTRDYLLGLDPGIALRIERDKLELLRTRSFTMLQRSGDLELIKGSNPHRLYEYRAPVKGAQHRFITLIDESIYWLLLAYTEKSKPDLNRHMQKANNLAQEFKTRFNK